MAKSTSSVDYCGHLESTVSKRLRLINTQLLVCKQRDRAQLKQECETLSNILFELQERDKGAIYLSDDVMALRERLQDTEDKLKDSAVSLSACQQTVEDNKSRIVQTENLMAAADRTVQELLRELAEFRDSSGLRLSLEAAVNHDLRSKLEAKARLRSKEASRETVTELLLPPLDPLEQLKMLGPGIKAVAAEAQLNPDLPGEEETLDGERAVCLKVVQLRDCFCTAASELWRDQDNELKRQNTENANLRVALRRAEEQLEQLELQRQSKQKRVDVRRQRVTTRPKEVQRPGLWDRIVSLCGRTFR